MNAAHFHLVINHFPVVLMLAATVIGLHGWLQTSAEAKKIALSLSVVASLSGLASYFSGQPAAEFLENSAIINDTHVEEHEEAAEKTIIITTIAGLAAGAAFFLASRKSAMAHRVYLAATGLMLISSVTLGWTAAKGGLIRHPEVTELMSGRPGNLPPQSNGDIPGGSPEESGDQDIDTEFEATPNRTDSQP